MSSVAINFSSGTLFATRTDSAAGANPTPVKFGILQEGSIEFDGTNKELYGAYQFPQDVARGPIKVMGKSKLAQIFSGMYDLFFGQGITASTGLLIALNEAHSVPASSAYTITVTNSSMFTQDLGVAYSATGIPFTKVASSPAQGQYSEASGVYTFASADASAAVLISYEYSGTTGYNEIAIANQLMGTSPTFSLILATTYKGNVMNMHLNQAISEKLTFPTKNTDYTIQEFDFQAYTDAANNLGKLTFSQ
jgi:hypothetical protein